MAVSIPISTDQDICLSDQEKNILRFIVEHMQDNDGSFPTMRDICEACKISSTSTVEYYFRGLTDKDLIHQPRGRGTAYALVGMEWKFPDRLLELLQ